CCVLFVRTPLHQICILSLHDALPIFEEALLPAQTLRLRVVAETRKIGLERRKLVPQALLVRAAERGVVPRALDVRDLGLELDPTDRKSTRLNSSHVKISYAVFCLKKK